MIKINLVAEGKKPAVARKSAGESRLSGLEGDLSQWFLLGGLVLGALGFGMWWWVLNGRIDDNNEQIRVAEQRVQELQQYIDRVDEAEAKEAALNLKIDAITQLKNAQSGPVEVMDEVSKALPELLWIDRLDQQGPGVTISGRAFNTQAVSNFIANLDAVPFFTEPELRDTQKPSDGDVYTFTIFFNKFDPNAPAEDEDAL